MSGSFDETIEPAGELRINKKEFDQETLDDALRVDRLCQDILKHFYLSLQGEGLSPETATRLAGSADYYVRDFVVDNRVHNLFEERTGLVRQFAGNWYIVNTLEPSHAEIGLLLRALRLLYRYLGATGVLDPDDARAVAEMLEDGEFFHRRLEDFWSLTPHDVPAWRAVAEYRKGRSPPARGDSA